MQLIISLNIFYFFLISYHAVHLNNNINYIDGICFHYTKNLRFLV